MYAVRGTDMKTAVIENFPKFFGSSNNRLYAEYRNQMAIPSLYSILTLCVRHSDSVTFSLLCKQLHKLHIKYGHLRLVENDFHWTMHNESNSGEPH